MLSNDGYANVCYFFPINPHFLINISSLKFSCISIHENLLIEVHYAIKTERINGNTLNFFFFKFNRVLPSVFYGLYRISWYFERNYFNLCCIFCKHLRTKMLLKKMLKIKAKCGNFVPVEWNYCKCN